MHKVFSSNEVTETVLVRDALLQQGIAVTIQPGAFELCWNCGTDRPELRAS